MRLTIADNFLRSRLGQARPGDRRRNLFPHPRLERPHDLRPVRRRRRRRRGRGDAWARARSRTAACSRRACARTDATSRKLYVDGGPSSTGTVGHLRMDGKEVFKLAVGMVTADRRRRARRCRPALRRPSTGSCRTRPTGASSTRRREKLGIAVLQGRADGRRHANTSPASIPLALDVAVAGRPHQARRHGAARSHGRRLHLGRRAHPLVDDLRSRFAQLPYDLSNAG